MKGEKSPSFWRRNGLSLVFLGLTLLAFVGHASAGYRADGAERVDHGQPQIGLSEYLCSGAFLASLFENWESEFLQMGLFVILTVSLRQKGSSESLPIEVDRPSSSDDLKAPGETPWPVRRGGVWLRLYEHSLSAAFLSLFALSFVAHWITSWRAVVREAAVHGRTQPALVEHLLDSQFWFESFQNWQSEFLAVVCLVTFSIYLREKDSPQSKAVAAPHGKTGS